MNSNLKPKVYFKKISSDEAQMLNLRHDEGGYYSRSTKIQVIVNNHIDAREAIRYSKGQIYKIVSPNTDKIYIGSTILTLNQRFSNHKNDRCKSLDIINAGDATIKLICNYPCKKKIELELEEARCMIELRNDGVDVVNKQTPGAAAAVGGRKEYHKEHYKLNKEKIQEYKKEYDKERLKNELRFTCSCCNKEFNKRNLKRHQNTSKYKRNMLRSGDK
jgi:hypothetical protein